MAAPSALNSDTRGIRDRRGGRLDLDNCLGVILLSRWLFRGGVGEIGGGGGDREGGREGVGGVRELARYVRPTLAKVASYPRPRGSRRVVIGTLQLAVHLLAVHAEPAAFEEDPTRVA